MDTINIILDLNQRLDGEEIEKVENYIKNLGYCDVLRTYGTDCVNIRLSYPRYFSKTNAYLIRDEDECFEVQEDFVKMLLKNELTRYSEIRITRADIPFTFYMKDKEEFYMYENIFKIFAKVYERRYPKVDPKTIDSILKGEEETLIYADRSDIKNYYQKIMIYNQYKKFEDKYSMEDFKKLKNEFPDLEKRIRIEYSIKAPKGRKLGKVMTLKEFEQYNVYQTYYQKGVDYILDNILNEEIIEEVIQDNVAELRECFEKIDRRINYRDFIYNYSDLILDYRIIREVLNCISNRKTKEGAVTTVKRLLREYEDRKGIIVMGTYDKICEMIDFFYGNPR